MPTTNQEFGEFTEGSTIVNAFPERVKGKTILITGANPGGVGGATAVSFAAASPKLLILAGRSPEKISTTIQKIKAVNPSVSCKALSLDLGSQESCRKAAKEVLEDDEISQIDLLINNAGVMDLPERTLSPEGIELQFATNHIGHFLFSNLILPKIIKASKASSPGSVRIVNLSSRAVVYGPVRFADYNFTKSEADLPVEEHMSQGTRQLWDLNEDKPYIGQAAYGQAKTANVLFSVGLNKRLFDQYGILSNAVHPGAVSTELGRFMDTAVFDAAISKFKAMMPGFRMKTIEEGCSTTVVAALDPQLSQADIFFADCQTGIDWVPEYATDVEKAEKLWHLSEELVQQQFQY